MADTRHNTTLGTRFRFVIRALGITGLVVFAISYSLLASELRSGVFNSETLRSASQGAKGEFARNAATAVIASAGVVLLALIVEVVGGIVSVTGRRTAASASATVGVVAAVALLVFVNAYSFTHHSRYDVTRSKQFTLPAELAARLRTLRPESPTTIVVLQKHNIFGTLSTDRDSFTKAAEEKVTEKVKDLVDLFREFGPRFNVEVLDTEAYGYRKRLAELTKDSPELKAAIESAPENSIFFHANNRVQRLAFNEFLQLDKTASEASNKGRGNLVLLPQGTDNFARRVLAVQERRPKVAVCVVHEWLSTAVTTGQAQFSLAGFKKVLTDHGFDVVNIILKKNWEDEQKEVEPAAYTIQESKLERLEAELDSARDGVRAAQNDVKIMASVKKAFDEMPGKPFAARAEFYTDFNRGAAVRGWQEILKAFRQWAAGAEARNLTEESEAELRTALAAGIARQTTRAEQEVRDSEKARAEAEQEVKAAYQDERSVQDRRVSDLKTKFAGLLKDVDLLIIPRHTLVDVTVGSGVPGSLHTLTKPQIEVIKDFMKDGKPVLACLGSLSGPRGFDTRGSDDLEKLIAERGIELGRDTILYDLESKAFAAIKSGRQLGGGSADIPPLVFVESNPDAPKAKPNPVGAAIRLTGRSVDQKLDLRLHAPRPVYIAPGWQNKLASAAEFMFTPPEAWNEERPFMTRDQVGRVTYVPRYEPTLDTDAKWGTNAAEQRKSFPVGVAIESKIPASWVNEAYEREEFAAAMLTPIDGVMAASLTAAASKLDRPNQRLIVFGSGNLFSGPKLEPAQEQLLLHSVNWLTKREDRLPRADIAEWQFPRVEMSEREFYLWRLGTAIGLPLAAVYLGLMAMLLRRWR